MIKVKVTVKIKTKMSSIDIVRHEVYKFEENPDNIRNLFPYVLDKVKETLEIAQENGLNLQYGHTVEIDSFEYIRR